MKIKNIFIILILTFIGSACGCPECKECQLTLQYEWKIPHQGLDIINMHNDSLIGSKIYYKDNPHGIEFLEYVKDSGHYVINKTNGVLTDSIFGFVPETAENKYLWRVGTTKKSGILFETKISRYTIAENYHGFRIVIQEWYKNIRRANNQLNSILVFKGDKKISENCLPRIFDFTYDSKSLYIYSDDIYKFNFDEIIKGL
jgi:hypothetical protein